MTTRFLNAVRCARALWMDTSGVILPYVTVMLVVIVGVSVLALDGARYMSLQTQLQAGADALALAAAAELDRLPDSVARATHAVNTLIANSTSFGAKVGTKVEAADIRFYSHLPASDMTPISAGDRATDPVNARFASVTVRPAALTTILPAKLFGGSSTVRTGATAVAGFDQVVCDITPLFICNPFETQDMSYQEATRGLQQAASDPTSQRRLIRLRQNSGETGRYLPGEYGFLNSSSLDNTNLTQIDALARTHTSACFRHRGIDIRPGRVAGVDEGLNVRFDIYAGSMIGARTDANYRPAENVRKGYIGGNRGENSCRAVPATYWPIGAPPKQATGLPLDRAWPTMNGRMGNGNWDFETYWQVNHGSNGRPKPIIANEIASNSNQPSRYAVYRYESDEGFVNDLSPGGETGVPLCYGGAVSGTPDRRIIRAAVLNCMSLHLGEETLTNVPVASFAKFFLTLPLMRAQTDIYVETVGLVTPGDGTLEFDTVQLYR